MVVHIKKDDKEDFSYSNTLHKQKNILLQMIVLFSMGDACARKCLYPCTSNSVNTAILKNVNIYHQQ